MAESRKYERGSGRANVTLGIILVLLGAFLLVGQYLGLDRGRLFWPFFVIIPGLAFFVGMVLGGRRMGALAIPGSIVTTIGLILLYQSLTNHWVSWAYAWALIPAAVGVGLIIHGLWSGLPSVSENGRRVLGIGLVLFVVFGAFFELVLNISGRGFASQWLWPSLLILAGVYLFVRNFFPSRRAEPVQYYTQPPTHTVSGVEPQREDELAALDDDRSS